MATRTPEADPTAFVPSPDRPHDATGTSEQPHTNNTTSAPVSAVQARVATKVRARATKSIASWTHRVVVKLGPAALVDVLCPTRVTSVDRGLTVVRRRRLLTLQKHMQHHTRYERLATPSFGTPASTRMHIPDNEKSSEAVRVPGGRGDSRGHGRGTDARRAQAPLQLGRGAGCSRGRRRG